LEHGWDGKRDFLTHLIHEILENSPEDTEFIIENAAGTGYKIGSSLDELARMKNDIAHTRIKFCLDSAHALAAGYEFRTHETAKTFSHLVESTIGWQSVAAIHLNDSKVDVGKKRDLHENIGDGCIGIKGFESLLSQIPSFIPLILETPGVQGEGPNKQNVERVKTILTSVV
jgi:apurinic endonuclease APN1